MRIRSTSGMTLMELLLVVVIIGIATAAILPRIARSREAATAKSVATVIGGDVETAFSSAARSRRPMLFRCDCPNHRYEVADQTDGSIKLARRLDSTTNLAVDRLTFSTTSVTIGPNGIASDAFEVNVGVGASARRITVSRTGQVRIIQ